MISIDLNCDMGESFGVWAMGNDADLMDYCSSINVACGFHAGDATVIRKTIETALLKGVNIGAHPSFPDLQGFGRRLMQLTASEIFDVVLYQVSALYQMTKALGGKLSHVKAHGALYNEAAKNAETARAIAGAVKAIDENLVFFGLANSFLISEAERIGLKTASEVFADRTYQADGTLTPRTNPDALIKNSENAISQVFEMLENNSVSAVCGKKVKLRADTICIHGDGANALEFARTIRERLNEKGIKVRSV